MLTANYVNKSRTYNVAFAPAVPGLVFSPRSRFCLGQCNQGENQTLSLPVLLTMGQCFFPRSSARNQVLAAPGAPEERTARAARRGHQQRRHSHRTGDWSYSFLSSSLIGLQLYFLFFYWSATLFPLRWLVARFLPLLWLVLSFFPLLWLVLSFLFLFSDWWRFYLLFLFLARECGVFFLTVFVLDFSTLLWLAAVSYL